MRAKSSVETTSSGTPQDGSDYKLPSSKSETNLVDNFVVISDSDVKEAKSEDSLCNQKPQIKSLLPGNIF